MFLRPAAASTAFKAPLDGPTQAAREAAADRFADAVVPASDRSRPALAGGDCGSGAEDPAAAGSSGAKKAVQAVTGPSQALPRSLSQELESATGANHSNVKVHADAAAAEAARSLNARAFTLGDHVGFADGQYRPEVSDGRRLIAHEVAHTMQSASGQIQLWRWPWEPTPSHAQLVRDALAGDTNAIVELRDFSTLTEDQRLTMIDQLVSQRWVGSDSSAALVRIWTSFAADLARVAGANPQRWRNSVARHSGLYDAVPEALRIRQAFVPDVRAAAFANLRTNRDYADSEMRRLGLPQTTDPAPTPMTEAQSGEIARLQVAAEGLAKLQRAQELARNSFVGFQQVLRPSINDTPAYQRVRFDPEAAPSASEPPSGHCDVWDDASGQWVSFSAFGLPQPPGLHGGEGDDAAGYVASLEERRRLTTVTPYAPLKAGYDEAQAAIAAHLNAFPQLYAMSVQGNSSASGRLANARTPEEARGVLAEAFRSLLGNITRTEQRLSDGSLDPLDLTPLHERLFASPTPSASGVVWSEAFPRTIGQMLTRDRHIEVALRRLLLQYVTQLAFLFAPIAGPLAVPLLLVGAGGAGANFFIDAARYQALADAAGSGARPGTQLVTSSAVDEARMVMEAEGIAFALAVLAVGAAAARTALDGFRSVQQARLTAQRTRILQRIGPASNVNTHRPSEVPYGLPETEVQVARPGSPLRVDRLNPNRRYLWVVDEEGNFRLADEGQGARFPRRRPLDPPHPSAGERPAKHGDLTPEPGGAFRGAARAGGELRAEIGPDRRPTGRWSMNGNSSYSFNRADGRVLGGDSLRASRELLGTTGTDVSQIVISPGP